MSGHDQQPRERLAHSAVVIVIDRLGAGFLGPYGNTWLDTPEFNRLATQSLLGETVMADSPDLALAYRAWWTGRHCLEPVSSRQALPEEARDAGLATILVTDEPLVAELPGAAAFSVRIVLPPPSAIQAAEELDQTAIGRLFLAAIEQIQNVRKPALVWIHSRGMAGPWDAPSALRQQFADEDDPVAPDFIDPPRRHVAEDFDPDELLGIVHAYAGQVAAVDACLGSLLDALDEPAPESPLAGHALLAVTSPRGYPLGEHRSIGGGDLYGNLLHVPLFVRQPPGSDTFARERQLIQPPDLHATLAQWLGLPAPAPNGFARSLLDPHTDGASPPRELVYSSSREQRAIHTAAWLLREAVADDEVCRKLFAKPDDRWEVNEVASHCGDVAGELAAAGDRFRQAAASGTFASLPPLAENLIDMRR